MLKTKTVMTGFWAFIVFNIPSWILLSILGWFAGTYITPNTAIPTQITLLFLGFNASGAGIMA